MLRVWSAAGQEVASIPVAELTDVRSLKRYLQGICGVTRFRQRLVDKHETWDDMLKLDSPADLQLAVLPFSNATDDASIQQCMKLADAAHRGILHLVEELLQLPLHPDGIQHLESRSKRRRIEARDPLFRDPPLFWACKRGNTEVVRLLLEAGAPIPDAALAAASSNGHADVVCLLLQAGASVNDAGHHAPLAMASANGHIEIVRVLLQGGADPAQDGSALTSASLHGHTEIFKLLLESRATVDNPGSCGETPLTSACGAGCNQTVQMLLEAGADSSKAARLHTPLGAAIVNGHKRVVQGLLEAGADIDSVKPGGTTPLGLAARQGFLEIVQFLLEAGADKDRVGLGGLTPIWLASREGHVDIVRLLLEVRADKDEVCGPHHATPLWVACREGHTPVINLLQAAGARKASAECDGTRPVETGV